MQFAKEHDLHIRHIIETIGRQCAVVAYTGKAASVLRSKGIDGARTIHSCIYRAERKDGKLRFVLREKEEMQGIFFFVIDEASMVGSGLFRDLQSFRLPIVAVGDPGQLEPVGAGDLNLMKDCDVVLHQIHRQAGESPIIEP